MPWVSKAALDEYDPERCRHGVPVDQPCDSCAEAAYERFQARYYGGSTPVTVQEQYDAAAAEKRRLG